MDEYLIVEFPDSAKADFFVKQLHAAHIKLRASQGYTIINNEIIGKNALTGADMPDAQRTTSWSIFTADPNGTASVPDETRNIMFNEVLTKMPITYARKTVPVVMINNL